MSTHPRKVLRQRILKSLPALIRTWQTYNPHCLLPTSFVLTEAAAVLDVTRAALGKHLTEAVSDGRISEVLVRRDWLVSLPGEDLPPLYAVKPRSDANVYELVRERPDSKGSNGISFVITPEEFKEFLCLQRETHGSLGAAPIGG